MKQANLKVVLTDSTNPYDNLAAEEFLTFSAKEGEVILYLWQNAHTIVIGRNQNPWRECNVEQIKKDGIYLARRLSGGGAVYHDLGNLNFTFIAKDDLFDISRQTDVILLACRLMGVRAVKNGRNDLTIDGRKFSGHAYFSSNDFNYHHGTIMVDVNQEDLAKYLRVSEAKLQSKGVASVRSRVANLKDYIPETQGDMIEAFRQSMMRAAAREYGGEVTIEDLPDIPKELKDKYASGEWRYGTRIPFSKEIEYRFEWGEVQIELKMRGAFIENCKIYSDALETEVFPVIEDLLRGCKYDASEILGIRLPANVSATAFEILELIAGSVE